MKTFNSIMMVAAAAVVATSCAPKCAKHEPIAKHVVFIGYDGWAASAYAAAEMPTVKALADAGAMTLEKRSVLPSASAINWASMFNGTPTEVHGYLHWGSKAPELEQPTGAVKEHNIIPTIFQILRDQKPDAEIGCFWHWDGISYLVDTLAMSQSGICGPYELVEKSVQYIKEKKPELIAICCGEPDEAGHQYGWCSPEYMEILKTLDAATAEIVNAVKEAGILDETIFVITADHGGIGTGHGGTTMEEMQTPFILSGKNIKKGFKITDLVMQYDVASTIAYILGIDQPQLWTGRPVLSAFEEVK